MKYVCKICGYVYDEASEGVKFSDLPDTWTCPVCGVGKDMFSAEEDAPYSSDEKPTEQTGVTISDIAAETLQKCGLKLVLGMVGHSNLGMGDAVRKLVEKDKLRYVGIRHEGTAAFAASAYGKLTGNPAAALTIAGPGATNLMTGLYDAKLDKAPLIALTGQVPSDKLGLYEFQEIDMHSVFKDVSVAQFDMSAGADMNAIARALWTRSKTQKGPVQLTMPDDSQTAPAKKSVSSEISMPAIPSPAADKDSVIRAAEKLSAAKRPILILGEGSRCAAAEAVAFAERFGLPVATTYRAKGILPDSHPLACGVIGLSGTAVSAHIAEESDCILAIGVGFSRHSRIPVKGKTVIRIDSDKFALERMCIADVSILSDAHSAIEALSDQLSASNFTRINSEEKIAVEWKSWRETKKAKCESTHAGTRVSPAEVCRILSEKIPHDAIVCVDVGNVAYSLGRYFESKSQRFLCSWYLGSIGVGLPSAIGACCAAEEKESEFFGKSVFAVVGDGGLGQYLADFTTLVRYSLRAKIIVFNNSSLAKISLEQRNAKFPVWQTDLDNPSFAGYAKLCGALGICSKTPEEVSKALNEMLAFDGPALLEVMTDPDIS